jgi:hypothetical protein
MRRGQCERDLSRRAGNGACCSIQGFQLGVFGFSIKMTLPSCVPRARAGSGADCRSRDDSFDRSASVIPVQRSGRIWGGRLAALHPARPRHKKSVVSGANADCLRKRIRTEPFTLPRLTWELAARGIKTDVRTERTFCSRRGAEPKKSIHPVEPDRPDIVRKWIRRKAHAGRRRQAASIR